MLIQLKSKTMDYKDYRARAEIIEEVCGRFFEILRISSEY